MLLQPLAVLGLLSDDLSFGLADATVVTVPTEQNAFLIAAFAAARVLPTRLGTTHGRRTNFAVTATSAFVVTLQLRAVPVQAPDQPASIDPFATFAFRVTDVP